MTLLALATQRDLPTWEHDDDALYAALARRGIAWERPAWNDPAVDWSRFDLVVPRTTWDYAWDRAGFVAWVDATSRVVPMANPPEILRWNTDKRYLRHLEARGVPIAPTVWLEVGDRPDLPALLAERGWSRGFLKPAFGQTARETLRFDADRSGLGAAAEHLARLLPVEPMMLQPYLPAVEVEGEHSGIFFGGVLSHQVQKLPVPGDYRVQDDFGATDRPASLDAAGLDVCRRAMAAIPTDRPLPYGRVDLLRDQRGDWVVTELELVEPSLFFRHAPEAAERLVDALLPRLR